MLITVRNCDGLEMLFVIPVLPYCCCLKFGENGRLPTSETKDWGQGQRSFYSGHSKQCGSPGHNGSSCFPVSEWRDTQGHHKMLLRRQGLWHTQIIA